MPTLGGSLVFGGFVIGFEGFWGFEGEMSSKGSPVPKVPFCGRSSILVYVQSQHDDRGGLDHEIKATTEDGIEVEI